MTDLFVLWAVHNSVSILLERLETVCFFPVILSKGPALCFLIDTVNQSGLSVNSVAQQKSKFSLSTFQEQRMLKVDQMKSVK